MFRDDLFFEGLKNVLSWLKDNEYIEIEAEDLEWQELDSDLASAVHGLARKFNGERIIDNYGGELTVDHIQIKNDHYYLITLTHESLVLIVKDNSRKLEELIAKYIYEFVRTISQHLGINDVTSEITHDKYYCTRIYFPNEKAGKYVGGKMMKRAEIKFHNRYFDIEYEVKEVDGKKYAVVSISCGYYERLYMLIVGENYKNFEDVEGD